MKANHTPFYIKAKSAKGLQDKMLQNNLRRKGWHQYQVLHDGKDWYAWFYVDVVNEIANEKPENEE